MDQICAHLKYWRPFKDMESNLGFSRSGLRRLPALLYGILLSAYSAYGAELPLKDIKLPPGFEISVYAGNLPNARSLALSPKGTLFVGTLKEGKVYAVVSQPGETEAKKIFTIAQGLNMPNGVWERLAIYASPTKIVTPLSAV